MVILFAGGDWDTAGPPPQQHHGIRVDVRITRIVESCPVYAPCVSCGVCASRVMQSVRGMSIVSTRACDAWDACHAASVNDGRIQMSSVHM